MKNPTQANEPHRDADLENWLAAATQKLAPESVEKVRIEVQQHYETALEDALACGTPAEQASRSALESLGDPKVANHEYQKVLLTANELKIVGRWKRMDRVGWKRHIPMALFFAFLYSMIVIPRAGIQDDLQNVLLLSLPLLFASNLLRSSAPWLPQSLLILTFGAIIWTKIPIPWTGMQDFPWAAVGCLALVLFLGEAMKNKLERLKSSLRTKLPKDRWPKILST